MSRLLRGSEPYGCFRWRNEPLPNLLYLNDVVMLRWVTRELRFAPVSPVCTASYSPTDGAHDPVRWAIAEAFEEGRPPNDQGESRALVYRQTFAFRTETGAKKLLISWIRG